MTETLFQKLHTWFLMCETMCLETAILSESFVADSTLISFLPSVGDSMYLQLVNMSETFVANGTLIRFLPSGCEAMLL
jgi:hypothetical protein